MRLQNTKIKNFNLSKTFFYWKQYLREEKPSGSWGESLLFGKRNSFWLFNINSNLIKLHKSFSFIYTILRRRGRILFINSPEDFEEYWEKLIHLYGHSYHTSENWLFGGLNNKHLKFYKRFSIIVLYNTDLNIVSECLKLRIPMVYFGDINSYPENIDYPLGFIFKTKEQIFWYFQVWRNLFKKAKEKRPKLNKARLLGYRKFALQLAFRQGKIIKSSKFSKNLKELKSNRFTFKNKKFNKKYK
jgi:hypothetical protein